MAKKEEFTFLSRNQTTTVHAVKWLPDDEKYSAVIQITHGMVEYIERYQEFAEFLTNHGFLVVGHDHVGHGQSISSKEDYGYFGTNSPSDVLVEDMHTLRTLTQTENKDKPYFMLAHSMGSYMLRKYLTRYHEALAGAVIVGTGGISSVEAFSAKTLTRLMAVVKGWRYRSKFIQQLTYTKPYQKYDLTGKDLSRNWLTRDEKIAKEYYQREDCTFIFTLNGYLGLFDAVLYDAKKKNARKIRKNLPILMISGDEDPVGDLGKGVKRAFDMYKKVGLSDIKCYLYTDCRHEILNEINRQDVYEDILRWLNKKLLA